MSLIKSNRRARPRRVLVTPPGRGQDLDERPDVVKLTAEARFWPKVNKNGPLPVRRPELGPCWLWTASRTKLGYGKFGRGGKRGGWVYAHRFAYELLRKRVPAGLTLDHLCVNPPCVNPGHLEPVTQAENVRRAMRAITHCPAGHLYDDANTWFSHDGHRQCRPCDRDRKRTRRGGHQERPYDGNYCCHGHEFTPENTHTNKRGSRVCRTCNREAMQRYRAAQATTG